MKIKLLNSNYDEKTGISNVTILTDYGNFSGTSKLHEEDREISSSFAGCQYAEMKAIIKYMKYRIKLINERIEGLENCKKVLINKKDYNHNSSENRTIRKQIYLLKKQKQDFKDRIISLHNRMLQNMEQREKVITKIKNKGEN